MARAKYPAFSTTSAVLSVPADHGSQCEETLAARVAELEQALAAERILAGGSTTDIAYVRFLGDRKKIEELTKAWGTTVIDRSDVIAAWVPVVRDLVDAGTQVFAYFNNHFAGHAPSSAGMFRGMWGGG